MPRITASTVLEHRAQQERAILDAARSLLAEGATEAPTLAAVAARTGLARSSVYQYFDSKEDLLRAVIQDAVPRWSAHVDARMRAAGTPAARILAYVEANVELVASGEHAVFRGIAAATAGDIAVITPSEMHREQQRPLVAALVDLGDPEAEATADLVQAVLYRASRDVEGGGDGETALGPVRRLLSPYLESFDGAR